MDVLLIACDRSGEVLSAVDDAADVCFGGGEARHPADQVRRGVPGPEERAFLEGFDRVLGEVWPPTFEHTVSCVHVQAASEPIARRQIGSPTGPASTRRSSENS